MSHKKKLETEVGKNMESEVRCEFLTSRLSTSNFSTSSNMTSNFLLLTSYFWLPTVYFERTRRGLGGRNFLCAR